MTLSNIKYQGRNFKALYGEDSACLRGRTPATSKENGYMSAKPHPHYDEDRSTGEELSDADKADKRGRPTRYTGGLQR